MSFAPTNAASTDTDAPGAFAVRLGWLMGGIERLGMRLTRRLSRDVPEKGATADQCEAWLLVSRAVRWLHALEARLARGGGLAAAETAPAAAARAEAPQYAKAADAKAADAKAGDDKAGDEKAPDAAGAHGGKPKRQRLRTADDDIRGKPTEAVVARICADMGTAARLLGDAEAARRAAQLAEQARALLNGEPEPPINPRSPEYNVPAPARHSDAPPLDRARATTAAPDTG